MHHKKKTNYNFKILYLLVFSILYNKAYFINNQMKKEENL